MSERSISRRKLFERWQLCDRKSEFIELYKYSVQKLNIQELSNDAQRDIKNVLHSFTGRMKVKWGKSGRHLERFVVQNEGWLSGCVCFQANIFTEYCVTTHKTRRGNREAGQ